MKIKIENLSKAFDNNYVLKNINIELEEGNIYGFVGRNGSGKSVLFKIMCGLYKPTEGAIYYNNKNICENDDFPENTRALIEKPTFLSDISGYDNLKLLADIQGKIGKKEIEGAMDLVGLLDEKDKKYYKYSLGMKQKLGIAQVIMEDPQVMIFDEPFNGLDNSSVLKIRDYLKNIKKHKIIIVASHIKEDIEIICDKTYLIDNGEVTINNKY